MEEETLRKAVALTTERETLAEVIGVPREVLDLFAVGLLIPSLDLIDDLNRVQMREVLLGCTGDPGYCFSSPPRPKVQRPGWVKQAGVRRGGKSIRSGALPEATSARC